MFASGRRVLCLANGHTFVDAAISYGGIRDVSVFDEVVC